MADLIKHNCLQCGEPSLLVAAQTIQHHLKKPWAECKSNIDYYFCASQVCETVYFALNGTIITQNHLRTKVGVKSADEHALICYCFDVSREDAATPKAKAYVIAQTKAGQCACNIRNPSGRCCLKDFP